MHGIRSCGWMMGLVALAGIMISGCRESSDGDKASTNTPAAVASSSTTAAQPADPGHQSPFSAEIITKPELQTLDVEALRSTLATAWEKVQTVKANAYTLQDSTLMGSTKKIVGDGSYALSKADGTLKVKLTTRHSGPSTDPADQGKIITHVTSVYYDGNLVTQYNETPTKRAAQRYLYNPGNFLEMGGADVLDTILMAHRVVAVEQENIAGTSYLVISADMPQKPDEWMRCYIVEDTGLMVRQEARNAKGEVWQIIELIDPVLNEPIDAEVFVFTPPEGVVVKDRPSIRPIKRGDTPAEQKKMEQQNGGVGPTVIPTP